MKKVFIFGNIALIKQREGKNMSDKTYGEWESVPASELAWEDVPKPKSSFDTLPSPVDVNAPRAMPNNDLLSKAAKIVSGGKFGTMQDLVYGGERPSGTLLGKVGQIYNQSGLAGIAPEVYPVSGVTQLPSGKLASNIGSRAAKVANMPISAIKTIAGELAPASMKGGYEVARSKNPLYVKEWSLGKVEGLSADEIAKAKSGIANYFKAFFPEANKADVSKATSMSKQAGGVWDIAKKAQEAEQKVAQIGGRYNMSFPSDATLVLPQNIQAAQSGMTAANARRIGQEASWFPNLITAKDVMKNPLHFAGIASPRINTNLGYAGGKIENAYQMIPRLSDEDLLNLGLLAPRFINNEGQ
jgi:hypothetical protein